MGQILSAHHLQVNRASVARKRRVKRRVTRVPSQHLRRHCQSLLLPHPLALPLYPLRPQHRYLQRQHSQHGCPKAPEQPGNSRCLTLLHQQTPRMVDNCRYSPSNWSFVVSPAVLAAPVALVCCWPSGDVSVATSVVSTIAAAGMKCKTFIEFST